MSNQCDFCSGSFGTKSNRRLLYHHVGQEHRDDALASKWLACDGCEAILPSSTTLNGHKSHAHKATKDTSELDTSMMDTSMMEPSTSDGSFIVVSAPNNNNSGGVGGSAKGRKKGSRFSVNPSQIISTPGNESEVDKMDVDNPEVEKIPEPEMATAKVETKTRSGRRGRKSVPVSTQNTPESSIADVSSAVKKTPGRRGRKSVAEEQLIPGNEIAVSEKCDRKKSPIVETPKVVKPPGRKGRPPKNLVADLAAAEVVVAAAAKPTPTRKSRKSASAVDAVKPTPKRVTRKSTSGVAAEESAELTTPDHKPEREAHLGVKGQEDGGKVEAEEGEKAQLGAQGQADKVNQDVEEDLGDQDGAKGEKVEVPDEDEGKAEVAVEKKPVRKPRKSSVGQKTPSVAKNENAPAKIPKRRGRPPKQSGDQNPEISGNLEQEQADPNQVLVASSSSGADVNPADVAIYIEQKNPVTNVVSVISIEEALARMQDDETEQIQLIQTGENQIGDGEQPAQTEDPSLGKNGQSGSQVAQSGGVTEKDLPLDLMVEAGFSGGQIDDKSVLKIGFAPSGAAAVVNVDASQGLNVQADDIPTIDIDSSDEDEEDEEDEQRPHVCQYCGLAIKTNFEFVAHIKSFHPDIDSTSEEDEDEEDEAEEDEDEEGEDEHVRDEVYAEGGGEESDAEEEKSEVRRQIEARYTVRKEKRENMVANPDTFFFPKQGPYLCELCDGVIKTNIEFVSHMKAHMQAHPDSINREILGIMETRIANNAQASDSLKTF